MNFLRKHWYDMGGLFAIIVLMYVYTHYNQITKYELIMWLSLVSLFLHQLEEYRIVGTFPGMVNSILYKSNMPDRYPLNTNSSLYINVYVGWLFYILAALFGSKAIWLGIGSILVSVGNTIAHTTLFNIKGKTIYNAGLATCWLFFAPIIFFFFKTIHQENLVTMTDYMIGIPLGITLNVVGILKLIEWNSDKNTKYIFEERQLLVKDRNKIRNAIKI